MELSVRVDDSTPPGSHIIVIDVVTSSPQLVSLQLTSLETSLNSSPQLPSSDDAGRRLPKAQIWKSLKDSIPHNMALEDLEREEKFMLKKVSLHKKSVRRLSKELYQVVSMYALLQGVIFAAVAQTTVFTCADWWGPVFISVAVTVGTLCGVLDKLWNMGRNTEEARKFKARQNAVFDKIDTLRWEGSQCDLDNLDSQHSSMRRPQAPGKGTVLSVLYGLLVLGFLVGFSALIITSCIIMLCLPCKCHN